MWQRPILNLLTIGDTHATVPRAILNERFRILLRQLPICCLLLMANVLSIAYSAPMTLALTLRVVAPGLLIATAAIELLFWTPARKLSTAAAASRNLKRPRVVLPALNFACCLWGLLLFEHGDGELRVVVVLLPIWERQPARTAWRVSQAPRESHCCLQRSRSCCGCSCPGIRSWFASRVISC
jgi:predicted signal transduction protein with EAL and GGDEF domain